MLAMVHVDKKKSLKTIMKFLEIWTIYTICSIYKKYLYNIFLKVLSNCPNFIYIATSSV